MTSPIDAWIAELSDALGVDPSAVDVQLLLDVARDAAHGVARPAAPLTTFLVGYAAAAAGGGIAQVTAAAQVATRLATAHVEPPHDSGT